MRKFALVAAMVLVSVGAQAGQSRGLSLAASDKSVQETKAVEPANAIDAPRAPRAADASGATETTNSIDRSKFTERPPGVDMSRRSRMEAAASQRRAGLADRKGRYQVAASSRLVRRPHRGDAASLRDLLVSGSV